MTAAGSSTSGLGRTIAAALKHTLRGPYDLSHVASRFSSPTQELTGVEWTVREAAAVMEVTIERS